MKTSAHKDRIAILRGGFGSQRQRSMQSGQEILEILKNDSRTDSIDVVVLNNDEWLMHGYSKKPADVLSHIDGAISTIRGQYGEDGHLYRDFFRHSIPYYGSGPMNTNIAYNKLQSKDRLKVHGLSMSKHMRVTSESENDIPRIASSISELIGNKYIIKPTSGDSGDDVVVANSTAELATHLRKMVQKYDDVLVEKFIDGKIVTCGVITDFRYQNLYTTPSIELLPETNNPFVHHSSEKIVPARLSRAEKEKVSEAAKKAHVGLGLSSMSNSDFIVTSVGDVVYLETNAVPSIASDSPLRAGLSSVGVGFDEITTHLRKNLSR